MRAFRLVDLESERVPLRQHLTGGIARWALPFRSFLPLLTALLLIIPFSFVLAIQSRSTPTPTETVPCHRLTVRGAVLSVSETGCLGDRRSRRAAGPDSPHSATAFPRGRESPPRAFDPLICQMRTNDSSGLMGFSQKL